MLQDLWERFNAMIDDPVSKRDFVGSAVFFLVAGLEVLLLGVPFLVKIILQAATPWGAKFILALFLVCLVVLGVGGLCLAFSRFREARRLP